MAARYRADIDGLRALAILPVVGFHAGLPGIGGGFVGVDVFFVISGYLITGILLEAIAAGRFSVAEFYKRRALRILPALSLMLLATGLAAWAVMLPTSENASRCGRWLTAANASSCDSGDMLVTRQPSALQTSSARFNCAVSVRSVGVRMTWRPL